MNDLDKLKQDYPWIQTPLVVGAPMRLIALANMAVEISKAGGIGFIGAGTDVSDLEHHLQTAQQLLVSTNLATLPGTLPLGIGFINWGADLEASISLIEKYAPAAVWFFAPSSPAHLAQWISATRGASPVTKIWVQIGSVQEAREMIHVQTMDIDVLVIQGTDAGGHGLSQGASLITLLPEIQRVISSSSSSSPPINKTPPILLAAGGITTPPSALAALILGARGICLGTRFLATPEAQITTGYRNAVMRTTDGGQSTVRTTVYDVLRGTTGWPDSHNARGIANQSYWDSLNGVPDAENRALYLRDMGRGDRGWDVGGRMTAYAGTGVGLVTEVKGAGDVVREIREGVRELAGGVEALL